MFGIVAFTVFIYGMIKFHRIYAYKIHYSEKLLDIYLYVFVALYPCYWLTMFIMRTRHAGKVCSEDYLPHRWTAHDQEVLPYIHIEGLFLCYAMFSQIGVLIVLGSGYISII